MPVDLRTINVDINDTDTYSKYFLISELSNTLTSGKNSISLNGTDLLKNNSKIQLQVTDVKNNILYTEIARPTQNISFREGISIVISIQVTTNTPIGVGQIVILGEDVNSKIVRWTKDISINPSLNNISKIRFYNAPTIDVQPYLSDYAVFKDITNVIRFGTCKSKSNNPKDNTLFSTFDYVRNVVDYRIYSETGNKFEYFMKGYNITITNINNGNSFKSKISKVVSDSEIILETPYVENGYVKTFSGANWTVDFIPYSQISSTNLESRALSGSTYIYKQSLARIYLKNIKTFTGNVYRFKLYRKSLNTNFDSECIADEILESREVLIDDSNPNRNVENIGYFYEDDHMRNYWFSSSNQISFTRETFPIIDSLYLQTSYLGEFDNCPYIMCKDDTSLVERNANYFPFSESQSISLSGINHDSNFIRLFQGVEYVLSANVVAIKNDGVEGSLNFYLTGSTLSNNISTNFNKKGINILNLSVEKNVTYKYYSQITSSFTLNSDVFCTLAIYPYNSNFHISEISLKPKQSFAESPSIFSTKIPFPVEVKNSRFLIRAELFDVNQNHTQINLETIQNFDLIGESLLRPSSSLSEFPSFILTASYAKFQSINVTPGDANLDGNVFIRDGYANFTSSWAYQSVNSKTADLATEAIQARNSYTASYIKFDSDWNDNKLLKLGDYYLWVYVSGSTPQLRIKNGLPTSDTDGNPVS